MFKKKKSGGDPAPMQELTVMKGSNVLLGGGGGGDEESPAKRPLTELEKIQREKDALETELKALRKLVDEKALNDVQKTEADNLVRMACSFGAANVSSGVPTAKDIVIRSKAYPLLSA